MFYLKNYDKEKSSIDLCLDLTIKIEPKSKYTVDEGLCSVIIVDSKVIIKWFNKIKNDKLVCSWVEESDCIINTAHPCFIENASDNYVQVQIKNLNNVIETYKTS